MIGRILKALGIAMLAIVTAGTVAEATPNKVARHRVPHSTRVTVGSATVNKQTVRKTRRRVGKKKSKASTTTTLKRRTTTKPR
jgi:hypothetical protein